jgi:rRNA-processing protein FCF1
MVTFIEIVLLLFIAGYLVLQNKGGLSSIMGKRRRIILDSCALIDGRVVEIVRTGFVADELVIPQFIINELQLLADGNDSHKRERARFGLDIAHELQDAAFGAKVVIDRTTFEGVPATDDKLIQLAKKLEAFLYTTDYNLAKVASIEAVGVLNVNELSQGLRPVALPGEALFIKIVQKGSNPNQGVGYLDDGTMIVVEGGARFAGKHAVEVVVTRMHQTVAGKMVFGQVKDEPKRPHTQHGSSSANRQAAQVQTAVQQQSSHHKASTQSKGGLRERLAVRSASSQPQPARAVSDHGATGKPKTATPIPPKRQSTRAASFQKIM